MPATFQLGKYPFVVGRSRSLGQLQQEAPRFKHWLEVDHRCPIDRLEPAHEDRIGHLVDDDDLVESDRVRPVRSPGAEDACERAVLVSAWMDDEEIAACGVEPGQDDEMVTGA